MNFIKLNNLRFFVAVYEERSISAAARKANATQSGVSVQLRELENRLGVALFERVSTGVVPTRAGEQIYQRAVKILREVNRLSEDVTPDAETLTGKVRVGIMPTFARAILAPVMAAFTKANPLVVVTVTEGYSALLTQMVLAGELDIAVVPDGSVHDGLSSTFLDTDLEILASRQPLPGVEGSVDLAQIDALNLVLPGPGNARRSKIDQVLKSVSPVGHSILEMDSMMTTLDIIKRGEFCSILPGCLCLPDLQDPDVYLYPIDRPKMTVDYLLIEPAIRADSAAIRQFTEQLSDEIRRACQMCRTHFDQRA
ncbi:MAG: LysR family transcriptional regulator [Rhizobiaceae bacterium]